VTQTRRPREGPFSKDLPDYWLQGAFSWPAFFPGRRRFFGSLPLQPSDVPPLLAFCRGPSPVSIPSFRLFSLSLFRPSSDGLSFASEKMLLLLPSHKGPPLFSIRRLVFSSSALRGEPPLPFRFSSGPGVGVFSPSCEISVNAKLVFSCGPFLVGGTLLLHRGGY